MRSVYTDTVGPTPHPLHHFRRRPHLDRYSRRARTQRPTPPGAGPHPGRRTADLDAIEGGRPRLGVARQPARRRDGTLELPVHNRRKRHERHGVDPRQRRPHRRGVAAHRRVGSPKLLLSPLPHGATHVADALVGALGPLCLALSPTTAMLLWGAIAGAGVLA